MHRSGVILTFVAVIALSVPPACAGWAISNCCECTDGNGRWCQSTSGPCRVFEKNPI